MTEFLAPLDGKINPRKFAMTTDKIREIDLRTEEERADDRPMNLYLTDAGDVLWANEVLWHPCPATGDRDHVTARIIVDAGVWVGSVESWRESIARKVHEKLRTEAK
ncbi:hypothetical protein LJC59_07535 [Desulfovibrio sp. OttesenSCG-928-A18]|nr:hypothetical protein [Desulfovibrio sp. OttesenSCG-928-A18]